MNINKEVGMVVAGLAAGLAVFMILLFGIAFDPLSAQGQNGGNVTVRLNATNTPPILVSMVVDDATASPTNQIDLTANSVKEVICNATISDLNGAGDIVNATARFYSITNSGFGSAADNNNHYRNDSCIECSSIAGVANNATCVCRFNIQYYANNETWECNMNVSDNGGTQRSESKRYFSVNSSDTVVINQLLAMQVPITDVDFGNLSATETSSIKTINVTNAGNTPTNITVRGFGWNNETAYQNISMLCEQGNISIGFLRYSNLSTAAFDDMINLTSNVTKVGNLTLEQRTDDTTPQFGTDLNLTFWRIHVPVGVAGLCNGTIAFQATNE